MGDIADKLRVRADLIALAVRDVPEGLLWRFGAKNNKFTRDMEMKVADLRDGGATIDYRRPDDKQALMALTNIRPMDALLDQKVVDIPTGRPKIIDKVSIPMTNFDGAVELPVAYDARLTRLVTREEAFAFGFTQSVKQTFGIELGGEAQGVKATASTELGFEARQDHTTTDGDQKGEDRGAGINPTCPAGYDITFLLNRTSQKTKTRTTGFGDVDHGIRMGKHWSGQWKGNDGKNGKTWPRWGKWDSFEEFMSVIKGKGRRDWFFAEWFWKHPASEQLIKALEKPLDLPFDHTGAEFDGTTVLKVTQQVIRGPKYESQRRVIEDRLVESAMGPNQ